VEEQRFGLFGNGLQKGKGKEEVLYVFFKQGEWVRADNRDEDDQERVKRMVRSNNFTQQTNALDVDKHM
jgi:hypothetical protein